MPLQQQNDPLSHITRFQSSSVLELLMWVQTLSHSHHYTEWRNEVTHILGTAFIKELREFFSSFHMGCDFLEIAVEYSDHHNIEGFFDHILSLSDSHLIFYILGRIFPKEAISDNFSYEDYSRLVEKYPTFSSYCTLSYEPIWIGRIPKIKEQLVYFLKVVWNKVFKEQIEHCRKIWQHSIKEKEKYFYVNGGLELMKDVSGASELPDQLPEGEPYIEIVYVPITKIPRKHRTYYGYGNITILYDAARTREKAMELVKAKENAMAIMKALGDENRLKMVKLITDEAYALNGKMLAEKMSLSPSVVSRHLGQLREAGILEEQSEDNRNITYRLNNRQIEELSKMLLMYLND